MTDFVELSQQLQLAIVSGYLGHKVTTVGRQLQLETRDLVFQTIAFGVLGQFLLTAAYSIFTVEVDFNVAGGWNWVKLVFLNIVFSVFLGICWRKFGNSAFSKLMSSLSVYRDDHEVSVLSSIMQEHDAKWAMIQVHLNDGTILESDFGVLQGAKVPMNEVVLNTDGIAFYPTTMYDQNSSEQKLTYFADGYGYKLSYLKHSEIKRIDINWYN
ncbi:MAG: hypothetical protein AAF478_13050 [Pseudomonadota bacterium]